jgi:hypothetical protein
MDVVDRTRPRRVAVRRTYRRLRPKCVPELTGDALEGYRRRVFIDVYAGRRLQVSPRASWFEMHYLRGSLLLTATDRRGSGSGWREREGGARSTQWW